MGRSVTDYVPHSELDVRAMLEAVGAQSIDGLFDDIPEAVRRREPLALPAGLSEAEVLGEMRRLAAAQHAGDEPRELPRRRDLRPLRPRRGRCHRLPLGVRHRLHALPAGAQPGRAADHLRVPDGDLRAHRHGRQQRLACTTAARRWPRPSLLAGHQTRRGQRRRLRRGAPRVPAGAGHRDGSTTGRARRSSTCRPARPPTSRPSGPPSTRTRRPSSSSSPTSSGPSRTCAAAAEIAHAAGALLRGRRRPALAGTP